MSDEKSILNRVAIERLKSIESRATPGPWTNCEYYPNRIEAQAQTCPETEPSICNIIYSDDYSDRQYADAKLITALRNNAIPLLLEMLQALSEAQAENESLKKGIKECLLNISCMKANPDEYSDLLENLDNRACQLIQDTIKELEALT